MATTYTPLYTTTITGSSTTSVTISGFASTYTDLVLICNISYNTTGNNILMGYNGDTGAHYSSTILAGNGSSAVSSRFSNSSTGWILDYYGGTANEFFTKVINIQNYANTTTYKTAICRSSSASKEAVATVGLWRGATGSSTEAITSLTISAGGAIFNAGTTFSLYGVASTDALATVKATGGDSIVTSGGYTYHVFRSSGTFTPSVSLSADILCIAGGGGSPQDGGGGGAGGLLGFNAQSLSATGYTVTVGAGGTGSGTSSTNGGNSQFGALTASVGGGRSIYHSTGDTGGSGGGGSAFASPATGGSATAGQGYAGGAGGSGNFSGGGGGAGAVGTAAGGSIGGNGGDGSSAYSAWGLATLTGDVYSGVAYYAGGGAGWYGATTGGKGGGGGAGLNGVANTGGGAAGYNHTGGSGIVIVRYAV